MLYRRGSRTVSEHLNIVTLITRILTVRLKISLRRTPCGGGRGGRADFQLLMPSPNLGGEGEGWTVI